MSDESHHSPPSARPTTPPTRSWKGLLLSAVAVLAGAAPAHAASSSAAGTPTGAGELTQSQIIDHLYGGSFTHDGEDFSNGTIDLTRIDAAAQAGHIFQRELVSVRAVATFSRSPQTLGTLDGDNFHPLLTVDGGGVKVSGAASLTGNDLSETIFALQRDAHVFPATGGDGSIDPVRTYLVSGTDAPAKTFLMFWEDAQAPYSDLDYNDLVVEVSAGGGGAARNGSSNVFIPLPAAAWSGLSVLGGMGLMAGLRRLRARFR